MDVIPRGGSGRCHVVHRHGRGLLLPQLVEVDLDGVLDRCDDRALDERADASFDSLNTLVAREHQHNLADDRERDGDHGQDASENQSVATRERRTHDLTNLKDELRNRPAEQCCDDAEGNDDLGHLSRPLAECPHAHCDQSPELHEHDDRLVRDGNARQGEASQPVQEEDQAADEGIVDRRVRLVRRVVEVEVRRDGVPRVRHAVDDLDEDRCKQRYKNPGHEGASHRFSAHERDPDHYCEQEHAEHEVFGVDAPDLIEVWQNSLVGVPRGVSQEVAQPVLLCLVGVAEIIGKRSERVKRVPDSRQPDGVHGHHGHLLER